MAKPRDTFKYQFKVGNKIVHGGVTSDLDRREKEHPETEIGKLLRATAIEIAKEEAK